MELWIRSQNKMALMKCTMFNLDNDQTGIYVYNDDNYMQMAGKYKTKERALQILDEIQNILQPRVILHKPNINYDDMIHLLADDMCLKTTQNVEMELKEAGQVVYQMPDE